MAKCPTCGKAGYAKSQPAARKKTKPKKYTVSDLLTKRDGRLARRVIKDEKGNPLKSVRLFRKLDTSTGKIVKGWTVVEMVFEDGYVVNIREGEAHYWAGKIRGLGSWKGTGNTFKSALTRMGV